MANLKIKKRHIRVLGICLLLLLFFGVLLLTVRKLTDDRKPEADDPTPERSPTVYYDGTGYVPKTNLESLLLIGIDKTSDESGYAEYLNTQQSDFLLLLVLDRAENVCSVLPLDRDTITEVWRLDVNGKPSISQKEQLCLAHTYGSGGTDSCENTVRAVENLLFSQKIDHYAAFTMDAVPVMADLVGGLPVLIEEDMTAVDPQLAAGSTVTLKGELALSYVRARRAVSDGSNQSRMKRQEAFLWAFWKAWQEKLQADASFGTDALLSLTNMMYSDCTLQRLDTLTTELADAKLDVLPAPEGEARIVDGFAEFHVDDEALRKTVLQLFYTPENAQ